MSDIDELINGLRDKNAKYGCECTDRLVEMSNDSDMVYKYFDVFADMLDSKNSYERNRAIALISANAKWDSENKIDEIIDRFLKHITDEKPITARTLVKSLPKIAKYKTDLEEKIVFALKTADISNYKDSMRPLVAKDIKNAIEEINR